MSDNFIKKLISQFLILALVTSSVAFSLSALISRYSSNDDGLNAPETVSGQIKSPPPVSENAFVESLPVDDGTRPISGLLPGQNPLPSNNLTKNIARALAEEVVDTNPDGPLVVDGEPAINIPDDLESILNQYVSPESISLDDIAISVKRDRVKVIFSPSDEELIEYVQSLQSILTEATSRDILRSPIQNQDPARLISAANLLVRSTKDKLYNIPVPEPALPIHDIVLSIFETQNSFVSILEKDPAKAMALLPVVQETIKTQTDAFLREAEKTALLLKDQNSEAQYSFRSLFEIPVAHALFGVGDVVFDPAALAQALVDYGQILLEWLSRIATEWLKNRLVQEFSNLVVAMATGQDFRFGDSFGNERFVSNWKQFLGRTFDAAAGDFINEVTPQLCSGFAPLISLRLLSTYQNPDAIPITCTLTQVISNVERFYEDFGSGGWLAFSHASLPSNYYYGALFEVSRLAELRARDARDIAEAEVTAGQGFTGTKQCIATKDIAVQVAGTVEALEDLQRRPNYVSHSCPAGGGQGGSLTCTLTICSEYETTTPGSNVKDLLSKGLGAALDRVVNAHTWEALIVAFLDSMAAKLFASGDSGVLRGDLTRPGTVQGSDFCSYYEPGTEEHAQCIINVEDPPIETDEIDPTEEATSCNENPIFLTSEGGTPGQRVAINRPGVFHAPTIGDEREVIQIQMPGGQNYTQAKVEVDVTLGPWNPALPDGVHNVFLLHRSEGVPPISNKFQWRENAIGYINLFGPQADNGVRVGTSLNRDVDGPCLSQAGARHAFQANTTYHFSFVYDTSAGFLNLTATDLSSGNVVASVQNTDVANIIQSNHPTDTKGGTGFFIFFGHTGDTPGEAPTYGWEYSNLEVELIP